MKSPGRARLAGPPYSGCDTWMAAHPPRHGQPALPVAAETELIRHPCGPCRTVQLDGASGPFFGEACRQAPIS